MSGSPARNAAITRTAMAVPSWACRRRRSKHAGRLCHLPQMVAALRRHRACASWGATSLTTSLTWTLRARRPLAQIDNLVPFHVRERWRHQHQRSTLCQAPTTCYLGSASESLGDQISKSRTTDAMNGCISACIRPSTTRFPPASKTGVGVRENGNGRSTCRGSRSHLSGWSRVY